MEEVVSFFEHYHPDNYRVYNLCAEPNRQYSESVASKFVPSGHTGFRKEAAVPTHRSRTSATLSATEGHRGQPKAIVGHRGPLMKAPEFP